MNNLGWIKLHRKLLDWEWWDDTKTLWVFIRCLLLANHEDTNWHGVVIKKGSFITSYDHLSSKRAHISVQHVRTAIKHLKSTGEITINTTNKYSVITIQNWDEYQSTNKQTPVNQQTTNKQLTTNNNVKNVKKREIALKATVKYLLSVPEEDLPSLRAGLDVSDDQIHSKAEDLHNYCLAKGKQYRDYSALLRNSLKRDYPKSSYHPL